MKHSLRLLLLLCLLVLGVMSALPVLGQCSVRADWGVYTIVRGDTLYKIARRFNTTTAELVQGNCLANANRINTGQQLRVPSGGTSPAATATLANVPERSDFGIIVGATYQAFEGGFMTWRSDTGAIWVFFNNGHSVSYPLHVYGGLSGGARYMGVVIPSGRNLPSGGFKQVYDNFKETRDPLGWAIGGEKGYDMTLTVPVYGSSYFDMSLPDGSIQRVYSDGRYGLATGVPVPVATFTPAPSQKSVGATFQPFENGFMVWRADTGEIRVFVGGDSGELTVYPLSQYGTLAARQFFPVPSNRWFPEFGFGKVWSSIPDVKDKLGWALTGERGYTVLLALDSAGNVFSFNIPDGRYLTRYSGSTWIMTQGPALPPT